MSIARTQFQEISILMIYRFLLQVIHQYQTDHLIRVSKSIDRVHPSRARFVAPDKIVRQADRQ